MRALVVGRFQPFHNGHRALIQKAIEDCVEVVVGVGSSTAPQSLRNPFSFEERRQMVAAVFPGVRVVAIPDIHDPPRWASHVLAITGPVDRVYGNDTSTTDLFEAAGVRVTETGLVERERFEAKAIRALMAEGDPAWRKAVPAPVAALLEQWDAPRRLLGLERAA